MNIIERELELIKEYVAEVENIETNNDFHIVFDYQIYMDKLKKETKLEGDNLQKAAYKHQHIIYKKLEQIMNKYIIFLNINDNIELHKKIPTLE